MTPPPPGPPSGPPSGPPPGHISDTTPPNPVPFVIAFAVCLVAAVLAFVFLRADDTGDLVRPGELTVVDDDTIRAVAEDEEPCRHIERAQVDLADEAIFVELVVVDSEEECPDSISVLEAEITLPEPVDGRALRAGVGRLHIRCGEPASSVTCAPDR